MSMPHSDLLHPTHYIRAPRISPHHLHSCRIVICHHGKAIVECSCGERVVLPVRNLRKLT